MKDTSNSDRLLKLMELFQMYTDEEHQLTITEIIERLKLEFGPSFKVTHRSLRHDIQTLTNHGFCIIENNGQYNKKYYSFQNRRFELYELRMLIDAVSSARFITKKESKELVRKIKSLTSIHLAKKLQNEIHLDERVKAENQNVRFSLDQIHQAIAEGKKITFRYGKYTVEKEFKLNREGASYVVEPYGLVWNSDFYYLIAKEDPSEAFRHYRVDRMQDVQMIDETFHQASFNVTEYTNQTFNMYSGKVETIRIQFHHHLINVIIDRFGKEIGIERVDPEHFQVQIQAAVSDGLVRWILTWGSDARVISPSHLVDRLREESRKLFEQYQVKE